VIYFIVKRKETLINLSFIQLEQTGSVISQTLAGLVLDFHAKSGPKSLSVQFLMNAFVFFNVLQFVCIFGMWILKRQRKLQSQQEQHQYRVNERIHEPEIRRGQLFMLASAALVLASWVLFFATAWFRLKGHKS